MKELKKPLGTMFVVAGALFSMLGVALAAAVGPVSGLASGGLMPVLVIVVAAGMLVGVAGVFLLLAQVAD